MINEAGKIPILGFSFFICLHSGHEQRANEAHSLSNRSPCWSYLFWLSWLGSDLMVLIFVGECFCILAGVYACCDGFLYGYFPVLIWLCGWRLLPPGEWVPWIMWHENPQKSTVENLVQTVDWCQAVAKLAANKKSYLVVREPTEIESGKSS